jgi:hypothetical protein
MDTKERSPIKWIYAAGSLGGSIAFFIGSLIFAWQTRHYQISRQPMPNGEGGFIPYWGGYLVAAFSLLLSVACIMLARRLFRAR